MLSCPPEMYCLNLSAATDISEVGGKAANLGKAISLGMRVPSGFALTRAALTLFLEETGMAARVRELLKGYSLHDSACRKRQYEALCSDILATPIPGVLRQEVALLAQGLLESAPAGLAVRSSGVCEDSDKASFAGIFKSFLCVSTIADLWERILRCWCSAWSPHLVDYATKMGLAVEPDGMAVIVQEMVQADSAGVLFTADPLTGNPWQFVLNATCGLAQRLVDGSAPADRFVLEWDTGQLLEKHVVEKGTASMPDRLGVQEVRLPDSKKHTAALSDETACRIGQIAPRLDRALDRRVDIEWAMAGQDIYLIQVRPVTALPAFFPHELSGSDAELAWTLSDPAWYTSAEEGGRIVAPLFCDRWALELWHRHLAPGDIFPRRAGLERDFNGYRYSTEWTWQAEGYDVNQTIEWLNEHEPELRSTWISRKEDMLRACGQVGEAQRDARRATELIPVLLAFLEREADVQATVWAAPQWMIFTCEYLLEEFLKDIAPEFDVGELVQGLPCYSYERTKAAQDLGRSIREDDVRAAFARQALDEVVPYLLAHYPACQFLQDYERFCWQFGMCPPTWPKQWARWSQDPAQTLFVIKSSVLGQGQDVEIVLDKCARNRKASEGQIRLRVSQHDSALLGRFENLLAWAQFWVPALDDRKWHCVATTRLADLLRQTGAMLVEEGLVDDPAGVLLFAVEDLERMANGEWQNGRMAEWQNGGWRMEDGEW